MRIDARQAHWLELARIDARRRGHEATQPEHLMIVGIQAPYLADAVRARGLDPSELHERVEACLVSRPTIGGYRDGSDAPLSPRLRVVIERARVWRWLPILAKMTLLDALFLERSISTSVFELTRGNDYRYVVERARALAIVRGHNVVGVEHVFRALLDLSSFVDAIDRARGDVERLRAAVAEVTKATVADDLSRGPQLEPAIDRVIAGARVMARTYAPTLPTIRQFCLQLAVAEESSRFWRAGGIEASDFVRAVHLPEKKRRAERDLLR
jgi:ATP-dependent Clp protease ATP-binding subunit ClpA